MKAYDDSAMVNPGKEIKRITILGNIFAKVDDITMHISFFYSTQKIIIGPILFVYISQETDKKGPSYIRPIYIK